MAKKSMSKEFMFLFRGGADPAELSREEMQKVMSSWSTWMGQLKKRGQLKRGHPLDDGGKVLSGRKGQEVRPFAETQESVGGYLLVHARNLSHQLASHCNGWRRATHWYSGRANTSRTARWSESAATGPCRVKPAPAAVPGFAGRMPRGARGDRSTSE